MYECVLINPPVHSKNPQSLEKVAEYKVSCSEDYDRVFESIKFWRTTLIDNAFNSKIADPRKLQKKAKKEVSDEMPKEFIQVTTSTEDCTRSIKKYSNAGFTRVYVHSTSPEKVKFVQTFCKKILQYFMTSKKEE
jgi:coenzyme F420-dependent glucose-6-phosphate dehydrogenase